MAPAIAFSQAAPTRPAPPAAYSVGAAYDSARARLVVFGGFLGGRYVGDTWEWDGAAWTKSEQPGPSARNSPTLVYDEKRGRVLMFGGVAGGEGLGDTWEFGGEHWTRVATDGPPARGLYAMTSAGPSARDHTQMVYDPVRRLVVLHGGGLDQAATETWTYDGRAWTRASFTGPSRRYAKMVFDTRTKAVQLYGGFAEQPSNELWQLGPTAWRRVGP